MDHNSYNTFISVAEDTKAMTGEVPPTKDVPTAASIQYELLVKHPYQYTQEDILFESSPEARNAPDDAAKQSARETYFNKGRACLRASALTKRYGWGVHFDQDGKCAAYSMDSAEYQRFSSDENLKQTKAMRTSRK